MAFINVGQVEVKLSEDFMNKLKDLNKVLVTKAFAAEVGTMVVEESRHAIRAGLSPVQGVGRFEGYKDPAKYPGELKPARPVNLALTGEMLSHLNYREEGGKLLYGIFDDEVSQKVMAMVDTHNRGTHDHVPQRQFIPAKGEAFIVSIQLKIKELYRKRIAEKLNEFIQSLK